MLPAPEPLGPQHDPSGFDCGDAALNDWLRDHALQAQRGEFSKTYVVHDENRIVGYYTLAAGCAMLDEAPERVKQGGGQHRVPIVVLARLAVDSQIQHEGIGSGLVRDALFRVAAAADIIGVRAVLVHMKREELRTFYERFDFEPSPLSDDQMFLLMKDLRRGLE